jgi:hypothetical protein
MMMILSKKRHHVQRVAAEAMVALPPATLPDLLKRHPHAKQMLGIIGEAEAQLATIIGLDRDRIALQVTFEEAAF